MRKVRVGRAQFDRVNSSILRECVSRLEAYRDVQDLKNARALLIDTVQNSTVWSGSKQKMIAEFQSAMTFDDLDRYFWNALLKFEGLGTNDWRWGD
jgi:hypothetical protein